MATKNQKPAASQKMQLIGSLTSPFVRKVRIVAAEKFIEYDFVVDVPWEADSRVPEHNPLGKVPVWIMEDGKSLFDSRVIVEYLENVSPVGHLLPKDARPRIAVKRWEALADGVCDAAALIVVEKKRPKERQDAEWIRRQLGKVRAGLKAMSEELGPHPWCTGEFFGLADIAVGCALGYLDFRFAEIDWRRDHPNLSELYDRLMLRQAFRDTAPVG
ncbi:MAG: glutathione S-transferase [bacterium]|nr:MAG: glutathione S-transferase [bacterium]KAF0148344.1 MAG: glutathione S-transferase [bacterium]KAF0167805.1 MAG: glutathione S-transferase [bacterium]TXT18952.1 MAG: glutathione S-transferase [bacterium]